MSVLQTNQNEIIGEQLNSGNKTLSGVYTTYVMSWLDFIEGCEFGVIQLW